MKWVVRGASGDHEVQVEQVTDGYEVVLDGERHRVDWICLDGALASLRFAETSKSHHVSFQRLKNHRWRVAVGVREFDFTVLSPLQATATSSDSNDSGSLRIEAPIPGKVVAVKVAKGDEVEPGQALVVLEAMKMENELAAERKGRVAEVFVEAGETVDTGAILVELE